MSYQTICPSQAIIYSISYTWNLPKDIYTRYLTAYFLRKWQMSYFTSQLDYESSTLEYQGTSYKVRLPTNGVPTNTANVFLSFREPEIHYGIPVVLVSPIRNKESKEST